MSIIIGILVVIAMIVLSEGSYRMGQESGLREARRKIDWCDSHIKESLKKLDESNS